MKNLTIVFISLILCSYNSISQVNEGFENGVPPTDWVSYIGQNGLGTSQGWVDISTSYSGAKAAYSRYENVTGGLAEDWLVTPQFTPSSSSFNLVYYEKQSYTTAYGSNFAIKVSTVSQMNHADFVDILTYGESAVSTSYSSRTIDLSAYIGQPIYIAFVHINDNGDNWFLDDVVLPGTLTSGGGGSNGCNIYCDSEGDDSFDGEIMAFGAMSGRDMENCINNLTSFGYLGPDKGEASDMILAETLYGEPNKVPSWVEIVDVNFFDQKLLNNCCNLQKLIQMFFLSNAEQHLFLFHLIQYHSKCVWSQN